jgi:hypothetical protein
MYALASELPLNDLTTNDRPDTPDYSLSLLLLLLSRGG